MISSLMADVVCLQEVACSNAIFAEFQQTSQDFLIRNDSLRDNVINAFEKIIFEENSERRASEFNKLSAILKCKFPHPNTLTLKKLNKFYSSPREQNVKAIIVKKFKIPIFEDIASKERQEAPKNDDPKVKELQLSREIEKLKQKVRHLHVVATSDKSVDRRRQDIREDPLIKEKQLANYNQELRDKIKWLQELVSSDKNLEQRQRDILRHSKANPTPKIVGYRFFLLVVIKSGVLKQGCTLDYVIPELPIFKQSRTPITIKCIVNLNHYDDAVDGLAAASQPLPSTDAPVQAAGGGGNRKEKKSGDSAAGGGGKKKEKKSGDSAAGGAPIQSAASGKVHVVESITVDTDSESVVLLEVPVFFASQNAI
jgi:hypothetical protein